MVDRHPAVSPYLEPHVGAGWVRPARRSPKHGLDRQVLGAGHAAR